jgi:hypothetical protein
MVPTTKKELSKMVTQITLETYESLTPQLIMLLDKVKHNKELSDAEKNDEVMLNIMGFMKSCTNEVIIDVLAEILGVE